MILDAVELEILHHKLQAIAEEMAITLSRTARSTYVKDAADFATALATPAGKFFAYPAAMGVSGFLDLDCGVAIGAVADLAEGDVIITNHPYRSGGLSTHMPDLQLIRPWFHDGRIEAFTWAFVHSADIGGGVPSSISPRFTELFQEGLQIPPMKLVVAGQLNSDFLTLYEANCRVPATNLGDVKAMLASLAVGDRRVTELVARHGIEAFRAAQAQLVAYGKAKAKAVQRRIPDGDYAFWDFLDDDFLTRIPVRIRCRMTVADGDVHLDFSGSDPQVPSAYNVPTGGIRHPWLTLKLMHLIGSYDDTIPLNYGLFENITVAVPKGTVLNPEFPAAVGVRHATAVRINDTLVGALAKALPGLTPAPSGGTVVPMVLAEADPDSGARKVTVLQLLVGGTGARPGGDGVDGRDSGLANLLNTPLERTEAECGVVVERYGLRADSGGPGQWRGGTGLVMSVRILRPGSAILGRGLERFVFRPWGVAGGGPGARCRVLVNADTPSARDLGKLDVFEADEGDLVTILTAGGGGFGDPFVRAPEAVLRDVRAGFVTIEAAVRDYGVVIDDGELDREATDRLRADRPPRPAFDVGPERLAWEGVFDDALMTRMAAGLLRLPVPRRQALRRRIFEEVVPGLPTFTGVEIGELIVDAAAQRAILVRLLDEHFPD